jgi:hypothetical protein
MRAANHGAVARLLDLLANCIFVEDVTLEEIHAFHLYESFPGEGLLRLFTLQNDLST